MSANNVALCSSLTRIDRAACDHDGPHGSGGVAPDVATADLSKQKSSATGSGRRARLAREKTTQSRLTRPLTAAPRRGRPSAATA